MIPFAAAAAASEAVLPVNTVLPTISGGSASDGGAQGGDHLTCSTGTWTGSPTGYTYAWFNDSNSQLSTSNPFSPSSFQLNHTAYFYCKVTASNQFGSATVQTAHIPTF